MEADRKLVLYIAMSLDGYIATLEGNLNFLSMVEQEFAYLKTGGRSKN